MIADNLPCIGSYRGIDANLDKAMAFIERTNIWELQPGRQEIAGNELYYSVSDNKLADQQELLYEVHRHYIDIQLVVDGHERIYWRPIRPHELRRIDERDIDYDEERDVSFFETEHGSPIDLGPGDFCVFFPQDAHKPRCKPERGEESPIVRKIVVKVRVNNPGISK